MSPVTTVVSSADLLRALRLAEGDPAAADRLARALDFYPQADKQTVADVLLAPPENKTKSTLQTELLRTQASAKTPLRCGFLTVMACEPLELSSQTVLLPVAEKRLTKQDCQPMASGSPPMPLLVRKQRLWPAVKSSLVVNRSNGIDIKCLTARMAQAQPVYRLPTYWRQWWGGELVVIWDRSERMAPYATDYRSLLNQILDSRGCAGLKLYQVDGLPGQVTACWPAQAATHGTLSLSAVAGVTNVLILSDLGALSASPSASRHWQNFARGFKAAGAQLVAWVPHSARQVEKDTARLINIHCLDRQGNLRRQVGRLQTARQRQAEHQRLQQLREQLLTRLAFCIRLEKELLRAGRELHPATAAEPALEGMIWSYRPVVRASDISRPLTPAYQAHYRARFSDLTTEEQQAALNCVLHVHCWQGRSTGVLETLIWESHSGSAAKGDAVKPVVEQAKAWISAFRAMQQVEADTRELVAFAEDLLSRNWQDETFQRRHSEWLAELWALSGQTDVPPGLDAADVAKVGQESADGEPQTYRLLAVGKDLMLWPIAMPAPDLAVSALNAPWLQEGLEVIGESPRSRRWLAPKGRPMPLLERADAESCVLIAGGRRYSMAKLQRPAWAGKFGRDRSGIFAELMLPTAQGEAKQTFRWIEPGAFLMGSPDDEPERNNNEGPRHEVTISRGFWLADSACTQALWLAVMGNNPSRFKDDPNLPVERVSWDVVQQFLRKLEELLPGCQADLPSEAEWEYACRAGTTTPFSFGANINLQQVNYNGNYPYAGGEKGEYRNKTVAIKSLPANPWGLYEMHGNVWEWCKDGQRKYDAQPLLDPLGPVGDQAARCVRGGSWGGIAGGARSAFRIAYLPGIAVDDLGFRVCLRSIEPGREQVSPAGSPGRASGASQNPGRQGIKAGGSRLIGKLGSLFKPGAKPKRRP